MNTQNTHNQKATRSPEVAQRLEYLRGKLRAERISWGDLTELQSLAAYIDRDDVELLEAAGVPEEKASQNPRNYNVQVAVGPPRKEGETLAQYMERNLIETQPAKAIIDAKALDAALVALAEDQAELKRVKAQRDELLAAAKFAKHVLNAKGGHTAAERDEATRKLDREISKAEGSARKNE